MIDQKVTLSRVQYAPEGAGFAALAQVHEGGLDYTYPVQMAAPLTAEFDMISRALIRLGLSAHQNAKTVPLRMVRPDRTQLVPGLGVKSGIAA